MTNYSENIDSIVAVLGSGTEQAIAAYTHYYIWTSVAWGTFWLAGLSAVIFVAIRLRSWMPDDDALPGVYVGLAALGAVSGVAVMANVADIIAPEAAAIHQLLKDVTP